MNLDIQSFAEVGDASKERLVLKASANIQIGDYAVFLSAKSGDGKATAGKKTAYWFPDGEVKAGDLVVLYTKSGERSTKQLATGGTVHFYYWGMKDPIWDSQNVGAVVLLVDSWKWKVVT